MRANVALIMSLALFSPARAFLPFVPSCKHFVSSCSTMRLSSPFLPAPEIRVRTRDRFSARTTPLPAADGFKTCATSFRRPIVPVRGRFPVWAAPLRSVISGSGGERSLQEELWAEFDVLPDIEESPVELKTTQDTGVCDLGLVARRDIEAGEVLVSVPLRFAITVDADGAKGAVGSDIRLALALLDTLALAPDVPEPEGDAMVRRDLWRRYTEAVLPEEAECAVFWEDNQIEALQLERPVEEIKAYKARVFDQLRAYREDGGEADPEQLEWAVGVVRGRSFMLDPTPEGRGRRRALVPVADLFNHAPESPATYAVLEREGGGDLENPWQAIVGDDGEEYVDVAAHRSWRAGEEVLLPYGLESGVEMLAAHGVFLRDNEADYLPLYQDLVELVGDVCEIELGESTDAARAKLELLEAADAAEAPLAARPGPIEASGHLLHCLQVAYCGAEELPLFEDRFDAACGHYTLQWTGEPARGAALMARAKGKAAALAQELLAAQTTTRAQDLAAVGEGGGGLAERRARLAAAFRAAWKGGLQEFAAQARG